MNVLKKLLIVFIGSVIAICICVLVCLHILNNQKPKTTTEYVQLKQAELNYWASKAELARAVDEYIQTAAPNSDLSGVILVEKCEKYKVDIVFVLAQGEQESHFGTKGLATKTNSVWNVGAFDGLTLSEIKHAFDNPNESIEPYLKLLTTKYITNNCETALLDKFVSVDGKRYASSPNYESLLKYKYETIKRSTDIDSLQGVLRHWIVQSNREY